ncbi:MAG TPA: DUF4105 domain-containing protein, partial [Candidatus Paceibacterota bacterium]|nr:DUF4105 domain-containing protein [Candidatus Paceibacterota bacterium]
MIGKIVFRIILILAFVYLLFFLFTKPSNNRDWSTDQAVLPEVQINDNLVSVKNVRNFSYKTTTDYTPGYYDSAFDVSRIKKAYYFVEPFQGQSEGVAHTFLSFEFEGGQFVAVSVEIRKEKGETFSALKGLFRQYEL